MNYYLIKDKDEFSCELQDLSSVSLRFDLELTASPLNPNLKPTVSSRMITCYTLQDPCYKPPLKLDEEESFEESKIEENLWKFELWLLFTTHLQFFGNM